MTRSLRPGKDCRVDDRCLEKIVKVAQRILGLVLLVAVGAGCSGGVPHRLRVAGVGTDPGPTSTVHDVHS